MALIKKEGNQIYKIYSPEMDISRSSLLSVSNDIAALSSKARVIYRYDNKLEDYDIEWITYNEYGEAWDIWYRVPEDVQSVYYQQEFIRKTMYWDPVKRIVETIRYHETDVILQRLPQGVVYNVQDGTLTNTGSATVVLDGELSYDLDPDVMLIQRLDTDIVVTISSYLKCKFKNSSLDDTITIPVGKIAIGDSGYITVTTPFDIVPGENTLPIDYIESHRFLVPFGGLGLIENEVFDVTPYIEKNTQSPRQATHTMAYDSKNRMITSRFRDGV